MSFRLFFVLGLFLAIITRFINLNWGNGFFFHPDENNMATAITKLSAKDLNPYFFAYGQFPLYLSFFTLYPFVGDHPSFSLSIITLRFWSAIYSALLLFFAYKLSGHLFKPSLAPKLFLIFLIFNPGLIQISHFGTTESILCMVFIGNLYFALKSLSRPLLKDFLFAALITATGLGSKLTAVFFIIPIFLSGISNRKYFYLFSYLIISLLLSLIFSPYNLISPRDVISTFNYESSVATGNSPVFYTRQFINTTPYVFQFTKIFPYVSGIFIFIIFFIGIAKFIINPPKKNQKAWFITIFSVLIYFFYFGSLFTKWTRFVAPVFFIFPLMTVYFLQSIKSKTKVVIITIICCLPGIYFLRIYLKPDIRFLATSDIKNIIPPQSVIFSEAGNVVDIPLSGDYRVTNFNFFDLDSDPKLLNRLYNHISDSEYVLVPSRRVFKNQIPPLFPDSATYYQRLFGGSLGFIQIKKWAVNDLFLNSENAEETWTVFDRPTIRLFKKN